MCHLCTGAATEDGAEERRKTHAELSGEARKATQFRTIVGRHPSLNATIWVTSLLSEGSGSSTVTAATSDGHVIDFVVVGDK